MKTALILLSILGMACAFSMKNFHRRVKAEDSEENGVFKYRPRYFLYKHAYFYPSLKRFPVQDPWFSLLSRRQIGGSDSSEENGDGDSSDEEGEEETSNEEENNEDSEGNEDEEAEAENTTLSGVTAVYGAETTAGTGTIGLAALQLPKKAGDAESKAAKKKESDEEEEEEEENENEEAEVDENEQVVNGTSTNSTEVDGGNGSSGGDNEEGEKQSVTEAGAEGTTAGREQISDGPKTADPLNGFQHTTPPPEAYGITSPPFRRTTTVEYGGEYEQTGNNEYSTDYQIYDNENGEPRGDNYRAYEDEYSYYKGRGYEGYEGQDYYYHQ